MRLLEEPDLRHYYNEGKDKREKKKKDQYRRDLNPQIMSRVPLCYNRRPDEQNPGRTTFQISAVDYRAS